MDIYLNNSGGALKRPSLTKRFFASVVAVALAVSAYAGIAASAATPMIEPTNFNTHSGTDYKGANVGFKVTSDTELESVEVSLLSGGEALVTNQGTQYLLDSYVVGETTEFSTPFITFHGTYDTDDPYWSFGEWASLERPDQALIVVNGEEVYNSTLTEPNGWVFESLLPEFYGENFNTHAGADYQGVNVGFYVDGLEALESVEVSLYDPSGNVLVTNTGTEELFELYEDGTNKFSTPFITSLGSYDLEGDTYWNFGEWSSFTEPAYALVIVNGETVRLDSLTGPEFASLEFDNEFILLTKELCKNAGWRDFGFRNQGQCIAAVVSSDNSRHNR